MGQKVTCQNSRIKIGAQKLVKILTAEMILFCLFLVSDARFLQLEECLSGDQSVRCVGDCESDYSRNILRKITTKNTVIYQMGNFLVEIVKSCSQACEDDVTCQSRCTRELSACLEVCPC